MWWIGPGEGEGSSSMETELEEKLNQAYRVTAIIAGALVASVLVYAGVVELLDRLNPSVEPMDRATRHLLRQVFRGLSLASFPLLAWLRGRSGQPGAEPLARLERLRTLTLIRLALAESIAIYGLALFLLTRDALDFYFLLMVSLLCFIAVFPRYDRWKQAFGATMQP